MKSLIFCLVSVLALSYSRNSVAQDNGYTMLKDGTTWCFMKEDAQYNLEYFCYIVDGDTILNNKTYKRIFSYKGEYDRLTAYSCFPLRENNQKIYCPHEIGNDYMKLDYVEGETILYDFSLEVDDTFGRDAYTNEPCKVWLIEMRKSRKIYNLGGPLRGGWIEGIGSGSNGLYIPLSPYSPGTYFTSLIEFIQDGEMIYNTPNINLAKENIHWLERVSSEVPDDYSLIDYHVKGDTVINKLSYKKVYANNSYHGVIRMNIEHKVYYLKKGMEKEILLYDFGWYWPNELHSTNYLGTDFVLVKRDFIGGIYNNQKITLNDGKEYDYRILNSNPNPEGIPFNTLNKEVRLIKDIGLTSGIFSHVEVIKEDARSYNDLVSVYDGDKLIYLNPSFKENGELETSIRSAATELRLQVTVSNGEAVFTLQEGSKIASTLLRIYSVDGRLMTTRSLNNSGSISINNLPEGVYYYRMEGGEGIPENGKFLMQ